MSPSGKLNVKPVEQLVLQGTSFCNIDCTYCDLSKESRRTKSRMPLDLVLKLIHELIGENLVSERLVVVWHSGEPLTLPPSYYAMAIDAITSVCEKNAPSISVSFDIQTNATLISNAWCDFFKNYAPVINIGVSCDGPPELHAFRVDRTGRSTLDRALLGMNALDAEGIKYNVIAVVTKRTLTNPEEFLDYFYERRASLTDFHFNVLASPVDDGGDLWYESADRARFYEFYRRLLDWWGAKQIGGDGFPIRNLSQTLERLAMYGRSDAPSWMREAIAPLRSLNMDADGNLTTFYAGLDIGTAADRYGDGAGLALGNIRRSALADMLRSPKLAVMVDDFEKSHQRCAAECEYFSVCPGGFELIQWRDEAKVVNGSPETAECLIHVKALIDAAVDFVACADCRCGDSPNQCRQSID
jgi:uncharacterized protein